MISRSSVKLDNATKMAVVMFFSNLYFYSHIGTLYLQTRGLNLLQINSLWSIILAGILVAELPTGVLADRIGREWSVVVALFLQAMGEFFFLFAGSYLAFVLIAVLAGVGFAFLSGASEALIYDSLPIQNRETRMKKAMGLVGGLYQLAFFVAPLLGGIIVGSIQGWNGATRQAQEIAVDCGGSNAYLRFSQRTCDSLSTTFREGFRFSFLDWGVPISGWVARLCCSEACLSG